MSWYKQKKTAQPINVFEEGEVLDGIDVVDPTAPEDPLYSDDMSIMDDVNGAIEFLQDLGVNVNLSSNDNGDWELTVVSQDFTGNSISIPMETSGDISDIVAKLDALQSNYQSFI